MHSVYKIAATAIMALMKKKSLSQNNYHNPARQSVSICMLLQSGVLSAKKSQTTRFFLCSGTLLSYFFAKTIVLCFLQDSAFSWHWEGGVGVCSMGRR